MLLVMLMKIWLAHKSTKVIYNGIDTEMFSMQKRKNLRNKMRIKYNLNEDDIVLLYAGRIHQSKGLDIIVEAFLECYKNNNNLKLLIVGGGYSK